MKENNSLIDVSFVIPCLNEANTIATAIGFAQEAIQLLGTPCEIIVADNGSTDQSQQIAQKLGARVIHIAEKGYGNALIGGITASSGMYIVMGDADGTYDFREIQPFIEQLRTGSVDIVMGSRLSGSIAPGAMPFLHRHLGTPVLTWLLRVFFGLAITDCNCGMRAFTKAAFEKMDMVSGGMEFASEMLIKAGLLGLRVTEIPCSLLQDTRNKPPHLKTWQDGWRHLKFILLFASKHLFYIPGWFLMLIGLSGILPLLIIGKIDIGNISFDSHFILVFSVPLFLGYQFLWLYEYDMQFLRFAGFLKQRESAFPLERYWLIAAIFLTIGMGIDWYAAMKWLRQGDSPVSDIRLFMIGIDLIVLSILTVSNALMISMMNVKITKQSRNHQGIA